MLLVTEANPGLDSTMWIAKFNSSASLLDHEWSALLSMNLSGLLIMHWTLT